MLLWNRRKRRSLSSNPNAAAYYLASNYNSNYDCLPNLSGLTGDAYFRENLYPTLARVYGGVGYLNGSGTNVFTTADSANNSPTTQCEIIIRCRPADWTPAVAQTFMSKFGGAGFRSFSFYRTTTANLVFAISADGTATSGTYTSTAALSAADNEIKWLKVTFLSGANNAINFYTADDTGSANILPSVWTQLGTQVTGAAVAIFDANYPLSVGGFNTFGDFIGDISYASISKTIDGAPLQVFNPTSVPNYAYGWRSSTGEDWLVNVSAAYDSSFTYKVAPSQLGSAGFYTNARIWGGLSYHPGTNTNYWSTPHTASYTGDTDNIAYIEPTDWTPTGFNIIASKRPSASVLENQLYMQNGGAGTLGYAWSEGGVARAAISTVPTGFTDGTGAWVRATATQNGANRDIRFYTSRQSPDTHIDSIVWTQLGATVSVATTTVQANTGVTYIGFDNSGNGFTGVIRRYVLRSSIGGSVVMDFDPRVAADMATAFTSADGRVYTVTKSTGVDTNDPTRLVFSGEKYVYQTGVVGNYTSGADNAAAEITTDIDIRVRLAADDYTTLGALKNVVAKYDIGTGQRSWQLSIETSNTLSLRTSPDGAAAVVAVSTVAQSFADQQLVWLRAHRVLNNGAGGNTTTFFTSTTDTQDPSQVVWTQLGAPVVNAGVTSIFNSTAPITLGCNLASGVSQEILPGKYYYFDARNGVDGVIAAKYDASLASTNGYTDPTNSVVWTHNRSTTGKKLSFVDRTKFLAATDDYFTTASHPLLNARLNASYSAVLAFQDFGNPSSDNAMFSKRSTYVGDVSAGWAMRRNTTAGINFMMGDGVASFQTGAKAITTGVPQICSVQRNVTAPTIYTNTGSTAGAAFGNDIQNTLSMRVAASGTGQYWDGEYFGDAFFYGKDLSSTERTKLQTELGAY